MSKDKKRRKKSKFLFFYLVYQLILIALGAFFLYRVYYTLNEMAENNIDKKIAEGIAGITDKEIEDVFIFNEIVEDKSESLSNIRAYLASDAYMIKKIEKNKFGIVDKETDQHLFTLKLKTVKTINKLGLINYDILEYDGVEAVEGAELYHTNIIVPSSYTVNINGKEIEATSIEKYEGFEEGYQYIDLNGNAKYELNNLTKKPDITIRDGEEEVSFEYSEEIVLTKEKETFDSLAEANVDFDALGFSENWSLFMTDDLTGQLHGYNTIAQHLIDGTKIQKQAYAWATQVDITFTSKHVLHNPPFTEVKVGNVVKYEDNAYTVDVNFKKNMTLDDGNVRVDHFNNTLFLIKYEGAWKVLKMQGVKDD